MVDHHFSISNFSTSQIFAQLNMEHLLLSAAQYAAGDTPEERDKQNNKKIEADEKRAASERVDAKIAKGKAARREHEAKESAVDRDRSFSPEGSAVRSESLGSTESSSSEGSDDEHGHHHGQQRREGRG